LHPKENTSHVCSTETSTTEKKMLHVLLKHTLENKTLHAYSTEIWWEAPMEGSVLSFLKAE
jgi:hypothetical protein